MVYRFYLSTGDGETLSRLYGSVKRAIRYQFSLDDDGDGLVNDQAHTRAGEYWPANQFYDAWPWWGTSAYVAGTWLATLAVGTVLAAIMKDRPFEEECSQWLDRGTKAYEEKLWNGSYYRLWNDTDSSRVSDVCLANQLMAVWCTKITGLPMPLPAERVMSALKEIQRLNMGATEYGLANGVTQEGQRYNSGFSQDGDHGENIFVGENLCAAMTFIYMNREEMGLEIAHRLYNALFLKSRAPWNQRCLISSETGLPAWGDDYYSDLVIWAMPMALAKEHIAQFSKPGKLVHKMVESARKAWLGAGVSR
jgi:non-lysosomal glucosylceramidase